MTTVSVQVSKGMSTYEKIFGDTDPFQFKCPVPGPWAVFGRLFFGMDLRHPLKSWLIFADQITILNIVDSRFCCFKHAHV